MTATVMGVISIKGGVGKTVTTSNLGAALAGLGKKVLLVDADFSSPNLALHFGLVSPKRTLSHVLNGEATALAAIQSYSDNLHIIPSSISDRPKNPFLLKKALNILKNDYDCIIIDASPTLNDDMLAAMVASDELIVVTSPDYPTLSATMHAVDVAKRKKTPITGLIVNKVRNKRFELTLEEIEDAAGVPVLGVVRDDINVPASIAGAVPALYYKKNSRAARSFNKIAASIAGIPEPRSIFSFSRLFGSRKP